MVRHRSNDGIIVCMCPAHSTSESSARHHSCLQITHRSSDAIVPPRLPWHGADGRGPRLGQPKVGAAGRGGLSMRPHPRYSAGAPSGLKQNTSWSMTAAALPSWLQSPAGCPRCCCCCSQLTDCQPPCCPSAFALWQSLLDLMSCAAGQPCNPAWSSVGRKRD